MNVLITGASTGIGRVLTGEFVRNGHTVIAIARNIEELNKLKSENPINSVLVLPFDLSGNDFTPVVSFLNANNIDHIDILIHNAGYLVNKPFAELTLSDWELSYKVNVIGVAMLTQEVMSKIGGVQHTHIVMIGSIGGVGGTTKFPGLAAYSSSKGALSILTEVMAEEFKSKNASVNCLALGSVQTKMLEKAFPGYVAGTSPESISRFIFDFSVSGWKHFNGKILQVSTTNP